MRRRNKTKSNFVYYNPNPNQKYRKDGTPQRWTQGDCVIRATCKFFDLGWDEAYSDMFKHSIEKHMLVNDNTFFKPYFAIKGAKYKSFERGAIKPTVDEFIEQHPDGRYILRLYNHLVTISDGKIYDTWDCGYKKVHSYYTK